MVLLPCLFTTAPTVFASAPGAIDPGDTAWVLISAALVFSHDAGPGLLLRRHGPQKERADHYDAELHFYGVTAVIWIFGGFSLAFGPDVGGLFGDISYHFALDKVGIAPSPIYASTVPFILFFAYQLMFAVSPRR